MLKIGEQLEQINKKVTTLERSAEVRDGISRRRSFSKSSVRGADMLSTVGENDEQQDNFDMSSEDTETEKLGKTRLLFKFVFKLLITFARQANFAHSC